MKSYKLLLTALLAMGIFSAVFFGCQKDAKKSPPLTSDAKGGSQSSNVYGQLTLSCAGTPTQTSLSLTVTADAITGAPAGFTIQWMTLDAFDANGDVWPNDASLYCAASFSGVPYGAKSTKGGSTYNLGAGQSIQVYIGDILTDELNSPLGYSATVCNDGLLQCGTQYVFRAFAHGGSTMNRSAYTIFNSSCATTAPCQACGPNGGHHGFGYWKEHPELITANISLGDHSYSPTDITAILNQSPQGNGLVILAHQLIAAKLNGLCDNVTSAADAAFVGKVVPPVGSDVVSPNTFAGLVSTLHKHNEDCLDCPTSPITN